MPFPLRCMHGLVILRLTIPFGCRGWWLSSAELTARSSAAPDCEVEAAVPDISHMHTLHAGLCQPLPDDGLRLAPVGDGPPVSDPAPPVVGADYLLPVAQFWRVLMRGVGLHGEGVAGFVPASRPDLLQFGGRDRLEDEVFCPVHASMMRDPGPRCWQESDAEQGSFCTGRAEAERVLARRTSPD